MNLHEIHQLFVPLSAEERKHLDLDIINLLDTPAFQRFVRDTFTKAPPLMPSYTSQSDTLQAAKSEGEKNVSRFLLKIILEQNKAKEEKPVKQNQKSTKI